MGTTPTDLSASAEGGVVTAAEGGGGAAVRTKFIIAWISLSPLYRSVDPRTTPVWLARLYPDDHNRPVGIWKKDRNIERVRRTDIVHCDERYFGRKRFYPSEFWLSHFLRTDHAPTHLVALPAHSTSAHAPSSPLVLLLFWSPPGEKHAPSPSPRLNSWRAGKRERERRGDQRERGERERRTGSRSLKQPPPKRDKGRMNHGEGRGRGPFTSINIHDACLLVHPPGHVTMSIPSTSFPAKLPFFGARAKAAVCT